MSRASTEALASYGSDANKRVLFFTYKFDFRWFHNFVLPKFDPTRQWKPSCL